jgi:hypothetical protein
VTFGSVGGHSSGSQSQSSSGITCTEPHSEGDTSGHREPRGDTICSQLVPTPVPTEAWVGAAERLRLRSVELLLHRGPQRRQVVRHDLPDAFEVDVEVSVGGDDAKAVDLPPREIWVAILELRSELGGRIRKDLKPPQDRILELSMLEEGRPSIADVVVDQPEALGDVLEGKLVSAGDIRAWHL